MRRQLFLVGLLTLLAWPAMPHAQSLADVARAEEARRKTVKQPAKVYTNDDLKRAGDTSEPTPAATAPATATPASGAKVIDVGKPEPPKPDAAQDEKYWKDRITSAREALVRSKVLVDALQSRVNALTTDFVNTDDPAKRAVVESSRQTALAEMERLNKEIEKQTKAIADIEEEARKASVPAGWLR